LQQVREFGVKIRHLQGFFGSAGGVYPTGNGIMET
jgi:hypothetical protein